MPRSLKQMFPDFKVINMPGEGFYVQCRSNCYQLGGQKGDHVKRSHTLVASIPEVRAWTAAHEHGMTEREAHAACGRLAAERLSRRLDLDDDDFVAQYQARRAEEQA